MICHQLKTIWVDRVGTHDFQVLKRSLVENLINCQRLIRKLILQQETSSTEEDQPSLKHTSEISMKKVLWQVIKEALTADQWVPLRILLRWLLTWVNCQTLMVTKYDMWPLFWWIADRLSFNTLTNRGQRFLWETHVPVRKSTKFLRRMASSLSFLTSKFYCETLASSTMDHLPHSQYFSRLVKHCYTASQEVTEQTWAESGQI